MKITADTNILVRAVTQDDAVQGPIARKLVIEAELIAAAIRLLLEADNVAIERQAVEAGLAMLEAGGDFADGVIAYSGKWLGGETFVSFDRQAIDLLERQGEAAQLPG